MFGISFAKQKPVDLNEIRQFIEEEGGKFIIVENGKPVMVISSFEDYKKRIKTKLAINPQPNSPKPKNNPIPKELQEEELKIEDLPF